MRALIGLTYLYINLVLKAAGRMLFSAAPRLLHTAEFSKCITHLFYTDAQTHAETQKHQAHKEERKNTRDERNRLKQRKANRKGELVTSQQHIAPRVSVLLCHIVSALPPHCYPVETVVMVIRSLACLYVKRDLYWADTISRAACARHVCVNSTSTDR